MSRDHNLGDMRETHEEKQIEELKTEVRKLRIKCEQEALRTDDFKLLMPLISPLVDAFDGMTNDFRSMMRIDEPNLLKALEEISRAIERY